MDQVTQDPRLTPSVRAMWRRAADELLIDAIFGTEHPLDLSRNVPHRETDTVVGLATVADLTPKAPPSVL